jgi:fucose 4-O-acetylase-like acetyltransferase
MDAFRGIAIVLVVLGHAYAFAEEELAQQNTALRITVEMISPFRIPAMVFLSGLLVPASLAKGNSAYLSGKARMVLYPYLLWSLIMIAILVAASQLVGRPFDSTYFLRVFYAPIEHVWFLAYLFLYYLIALPLQRIPAIFPAIVFLVFSVLPGWEGGMKFWFLACFFFLGILAAQYKHLWLSIIRRLPVGLVCLTVGMGAFAASLNDGDSERYVASFAPFVLMSIVGASSLLLYASDARFFIVFRYIGARSIVFYLVHWPVILVLNEVVAKISNIGVVPLVVLSTVAALTISLAICYVMEHVSGIGFLFGLPKRGVPRFSKVKTG